MIVETDAALVMLAVESTDWLSCPAGFLIKEIQDLARLNFNSFKCSAVPRSCNSAAHALAAAGCACGEGDNPILAPLPECIGNIVAADLSGLNMIGGTSGS